MILIPGIQYCIGGVQYPVAWDSVPHTPGIQYPTPPGIQNWGEMEYPPQFTDKIAYGSICPGWIFPKYLSFFAKSWKPVAPSI